MILELVLELYYGVILLPNVFNGLIPHISISNVTFAAHFPEVKCYFAKKGLQYKIIKVINANIISTNVYLTYTHFSILDKIHIHKGKQYTGNIIF